MSIIRLPAIFARSATAVRIVFLNGAIAVAAAGQLPVQLPPAGTPAEVIQQQIDAAGMRQALKARIARSGLSPADIRQRLASMGYDPRTLDPYLDDSNPTPPAPGANALAAVRSLGFDDVLVVRAPDARPAPAPPTDEEKREKLRVFGVEVFSRGSSQFDAPVAAALPSTYQLGPGDELVLVITGQVELAHSLPVTREGYVVIPQVGQVWVNGLTLGALREQLYSRLGRVYSGIRKGEGATTHFDISVSKTRTNQVYVTGEVAAPGSYTASPLASVLNLLYQAGGPTGNGTFRAVQVVRQGKAVETVDLYRYLLSGDNLSDFRLEVGDVVFVPVHMRHVTVRGEVNRPAIYELRDNETVASLIQFAGGLTAPAYKQRARLERYLSPTERREPGVDRIAVDIDLAQALSSPSTAPTLRAGDEITIYGVSGEVRHSVSVSGSVWREGSYAFTAGMRAWDVIRSGDGLLPDAYRARAQITRLDRADGTLSVIPFSLTTDAQGNPVENPVLQEDDIVRVLSRGDVSRDSLTVEVTGAVGRPRQERFERGMTLRDAIIRVGGLRRIADPTVEVSRLASPAERLAGKTASIIKIRVDSSYFTADEAIDFYLGDPAALASRVGGGDAAGFQLQPDDRVLVRTIPDFDLPRVVVIRGEVRYPAAYTLKGRDERLRSVILDRAGGLTANAYAGGFQLVRSGSKVDIDLQAVLRDAGHADNLALMPADTLIVPEYDPVVTVRGAVNTPGSVLYKRGEGMDYYIGAAGGFSRYADEDRTNVRYLNGRSAVISKHLHLFASKPDVEPGAVITVPALSPDDRRDWGKVLTESVQVLASLATVALVLVRVK